MMDLGSQEFLGEKLTDVRELNGLSRKELADELNVTEQAVWQYEADLTTPRAEVLNQLQSILGVRASFFFKPPLVERNARPNLNVAYRSKDWESRKKTKSETSYNVYLGYFIRFFEQQIVQKEAPIMSMIRGAKEYVIKHQPLDDSKINQLAERTRVVLGVKNNRDLMAKIELSGIYVVEKNLGSTIDAYSVLNQEAHPIIVLGSFRKTAVRRNYDLAHELGHILLHQTVDMDSLNSDEHNAVEHQADLFAGAFLMPQKEFIDDYAAIRRHSNPDYYVDMKHKYVTSIAALEMRARQLGLVTPQENRYFWGKMTKSGYRKFEPLDDQLVPVKPGRTRSLIKFVFAHGLMTVQGMTDKLEVYPELIAGTLGLDKDFFNQFRPQKPEFFGSENVIQMPK